jgi:putative hemolysin
MVEELVGEIMHEHEVPSLLTRDPDGSTMVAGNTQVREVTRALDLELPEGDWSTMAGLAIALAGGIPRPGDALKAQDGSTIEVLEASPRKVQKLRIRPPVRARAQGEQG